jgi:integral membrane sensor domain MASE1
MKQLILTSLLTAAFLIQSASAQEFPSQSQRLEVLLLPILVIGSLAISLAISAALYKSKSGKKPKGKKR